MRSPYTVLGVSKTAKTEEIKSAYRQLAKTWHPDQNPDNTQAGSRFAEISNAYHLLIDPDLRKQFDDGDIDARGKRRVKPVPKKSRSFTGNPFKVFKDALKGTQTAENPNAEDDAFFDDMVAHIFGKAAPRREKAEDANSAHNTDSHLKTDMPGMDDDPLAALDTLFAKWKIRHKAQNTPSSDLPLSHHKIEISVEEAFSGLQSFIRFADGTRTSFQLPAGTLDRAELRVPSPAPDRLGDAIVSVHYLPHARFRSFGHDLHSDHAIELKDAVLGGSFVFNGIDGPLKISIPEWSNSNRVLRIAGKGLPKSDGTRGALHIHLHIMLPEKPDPRLKDLMRSSQKAFYV